MIETCDSDSALVNVSQGMTEMMSYFVWLSLKKT